MTLDDLKAQLKPAVEARRAAYARLTAAERALIQKARETGGVPAVRDLADNVRFASEEHRKARNDVDHVVFSAPTELQHQLTAGDLGIAG